MEIKSHNLHSRLSMKAQSEDKKLCIEIFLPFMFVYELGSTAHQSHTVVSALVFKCTIRATLDPFVAVKPGPKFLLLLSP